MSLHPISTALFVGLVLVMAFLTSRVVQQASGPLASAAILVVYLVVPGVLAWQRLLDRYDPMPAPPLLLLLLLTLTTTVLALSALGTRVAATIGIAGLVWFQSFRIAVELILHRLYEQDVVPVQMTFAGRNFDIVTGITALVLGFWMIRGGRPGRGLLLGWNGLGLVLLANIVTVALLSAPVAFRRFTEGPPNLLPSTFPDIWLPSFLVQLALFGHLVMFRALLRRPA